jgi:hypothetical protein
MRNSMGREIYICEDADGNGLSVPIEHTSISGGADGEQHQLESGCDFGYAELLELLHITNDIMCQGNYVATSSKYVAK